MEFQALIRSDAEIGYSTYTNISGSTITKGTGGYLSTNTASNTGYGVVNTTTGAQALFVGVAEKNIANTVAGRFISWGYAASVEIFGLGTSITVGAGNPIGPGLTASLGGFNSAGLTYAYGPIVAIEAVANTCSAGTWVKGFVRGM